MKSQRLLGHETTYENIVMIIKPKEELKFLPRNVRWLRACLEGSCCSRGFLPMLNQIIFYRASGPWKQRPSSGLRTSTVQFLTST